MTEPNPTIEATTPGSPDTTAAVANTNEVLAAIQAYVSFIYPGETAGAAASFLTSASVSVQVEADIVTRFNTEDTGLRSALLDALVGIIVTAKTAGIDLAELIDSNARQVLGKGVQISFVE